MEEEQDDEEEDLVAPGSEPEPKSNKCTVVVCHVTIVSIGHGLLKKFWLLVIGCVLRTAGSSII